MTNSNRSRQLVLPQYTTFTHRPLSILTLLLSILILLHSNPLVVVHALSSPTTTTATIRVCTGSSCTSKCRGGFDPKSSLERLQTTDATTTTTDTDHAVRIQEVYCMNQCKRGPNLRILLHHDEQEQEQEHEIVMTFDEGLGVTNEVERKRKSFQEVRNEERVGMVWGLAKGLVDGSVVGVESGSAEKLGDILPQ